MKPCSYMPGWWHVAWDKNTGSYYICRVGADDKYDLRIAPAS